MDVIGLDGIDGIFKEGYGTISKSVMQDRNLHVRAKALYAYMNSYSGAIESCFPSRNKIAYDLGISNVTLGKYVKQLSENGYINVEQSKVNGRFSHNIYTILRERIQCTEKIDTKNTEYKNLNTNNNSINKSFCCNSKNETCNEGSTQNVGNDAISKAFSNESDAYQLARFLEEEIVLNSPQFPRSEKQRQRWARDIDLMLRRDGIDADSIAAVIQWCQRDNFWRSNILSGKKLRQQYLQLSVKMKSNNRR